MMVILIDSNDADNDYCECSDKDPPLSVVP